MTIAMVDFGNRLSTATVINPNATLRSSVGLNDRFDFLRFNLNRHSLVSATLYKLNSNADLALMDRSGKILRQSKRSENRTEFLRKQLSPGKYFLRITGGANNTEYQLRLQSSPSPTVFNATASSSNALPLIPPVQPSSPPQLSSSSSPSLSRSTPSPLPQKAWTVMVYMAADDLETFAIDDFLEMAAVGSTQDINVVVQLDRTAQYAGTVYDDTRYGDWLDTRRGLVQRGDQPTQLWGDSVGEVNMGDSRTLKDFVNWSMRHYTADHYGLVLWGHGDGLTAAFDDFFQDGISASELSQVVSTAPQKIDLIGADNCLMGNVEFAYELKNYASVLVASQENEPGSGWTYNTLLADLAAKPTATPLEFGKAIVNRYGEYYNATAFSDVLTLSAIDLTTLGSLSQPNSLIGSLNQFANTVLTHATSFDLDELDRLRDRSDAVGKLEGYTDILSLWANIAKTFSLSASIRNAATYVVNAFEQLDGWYYSSTAKPLMSKATHAGLSIYFANKDRAPRLDYTSSQLQFAKDTQWDNFLNSWLWW